MRLVRELQQVELVRDRAVDVREEGEVAAEARAEGAVDVRLVDGDGGDAAELALDLVLEVDEVAQAHLLLRAPPAAHEREDQRLAGRELAQRALAAACVGQSQVGERVAGCEVVPHGVRLLRS